MRTNTKYPATKGQVGYLHGLYSALGWDEEQYRFVLENDYNVKHTNELGYYEAKELIGLLKAIVSGEQVVRATPKQCTYIRALWLPIDYSKGAHADLHLNAFIRRRFKKETVEDLTKHEAIRLIKMIGAMTKQAAERAGKTTVLKVTKPCHYCGQDIMWVQLASGERVPFDYQAGTGAELIATKFHECHEDSR